MTLEEHPACELPLLPRDEQGPVFRAPWEAQAFAMALALHEGGAFTWPEWAAALTEAIRRALEERRTRLTAPSSKARRTRVLRFLRTKVWASVPKEQLGRRLTGDEEDALLGYGPEGV